MRPRGRPPLVAYYTVTDLTTDEARVLAAALDDAGFERDQQTSPYQLEYNIDLEEGSHRPVNIMFYPQLQIWPLSDMSGEANRQAWNLGKPDPQRHRSARRLTP